MEEVRLFGAWFSPFTWRVIWALKLKGVDYTYIEDDLSNKSALLLKYNPVYKKVPVLVHGEKPIVDSLVILEYIEETWPQNPLLPKDPYERAVARFWAKFVHDKTSSIREFFMKAGEGQQKAISDLLEMLRAVEEESSIGHKKFFGRDELGMVDLTCGIIAHWLVVMEEAAGVKLIDPHKFPLLHVWMKNFKEVPFIKEKLPAHDDLVAFFKRRREITLASS